MNKLIEVLLMVLITIVIIFAIVFKSPLVAFAGLLISGGVVLWCSDTKAKRGRNAYNN